MYTTFMYCMIKLYIRKISNKQLEIANEEMHRYANNMYGE